MIIGVRKMPGIVNKWKSYTKEELEKLGLVNTHKKFSDLLIYKKDDKVYLFKHIDKNRLKLYI